MLTIDRLDATLGAVVTGIRLPDIDNTTWSEIEAAFHQHAVLVFPDQHLTEDEQIAFARRFGVLEDIGGGDLTAVSNVRKNGAPFPDDHPVTYLLRGNEGWHTDSSYMPVSAKASMLSAHILPPTGTSTEWADMRAAYDALPAARRHELEGLSALHSLAYSQAKVGQTSAPANFYGFYDGPPPRRPLVKVHPVTGRRALFIGRHAHAVSGLDGDASDRLLDELLSWACQPPRLYEHQWEVGDLVVWDNRCVLHRACPYDTTQPRIMKHTRVKGDPLTEKGDE